MTEGIFISIFVIIGISFFLKILVKQGDQTTPDGRLRTGLSFTIFFKKIFGKLPLLFQLTLDAVRCVVAFVILGGVALFAYAIFQQFGIATLL